MAFIKTSASKDTCQLWQKRPCSPASLGQADPADEVVLTSHCASHMSWSRRHWPRAFGLVNSQEPHTQTTESFVILSLAYKSMKWPFHGIGSIKVSWKIGKVHWHRASTDSLISKTQVTQLNSKVAFHSTPPHCICLPPVNKNKWKYTTMQQPVQQNPEAASLQCTPELYTMVQIFQLGYGSDRLRCFQNSPRFPSSSASTYSPASLGACWLSFSATGDSEIAATFKEFLMELSSQMCKLMICTPQQWLASLYKFLRTAFRSRI